mgnify:CR=1 FL=1
MKLIPTFKSDKTIRNCKFCIFFWSMLIIFFSVESLADEMGFKFKSPSFNGNNTSSHYLTIENQEFNRKMTIKEEIKAIQEILGPLQNVVAQSLEKLELIKRLKKGLQNTAENIINETK